MKVSSSLGNLNPASLKALPKSFSLGKSIWQVLQDVPYCGRTPELRGSLPKRDLNDQGGQNYEYATVKSHPIASLLLI